MGSLARGDSAVGPRRRRGGRAGRHRRAEVGGMPEPERRGLDHEHLGGRVVEGGDEGHVGVAHGLGSPSGPPQHGRDHHRDRGLAVGPGDGDDRSPVPALGQVELADRHQPGVRRCGEGGMGLGQAGCGQEGRRPAGQVGPVARRGRADEGEAEVGGEPAVLVGGPVVGGREGHAPGGERTSGSPAHHAEAGHEHALARGRRGAHRPPAPVERKSA